MNIRDCMEIETLINHKLLVLQLDMELIHKHQRLLLQVRISLNMVEVVHKKIFLADNRVLNTMVNKIII